MATTRRRLLASVVGAAALAGCNDGASQEVEETVTPLEVPETDREVLDELSSIEVPSVPGGVVVSDAHFRSALDQVEAMRASVTARLDEVDDTGESEDTERFARLFTTPERALEETEDGIRRAEEVGPSEEALRTFRRAVDTLAPVDAFLRVETGDLDVAGLREMLERERDAASWLEERDGYRVARPVTDHLPTVGAAERDDRFQVELDDLKERIERAEAEDDESRRTEQMADAYRRLQERRRRRDDAEQYFRTGTDPDAPSIRPALAAELDALAAELEATAERFQEDVDDDAGGETVAGEIRSIRANVGERTVRFRSRLPQYREEGRLAGGLLQGTRRVIEYESIADAVERTLPLLEQREFPTGAVVDEKRRAVDALERVAEGTPLQRRFARTARQVVDSENRIGGAETVDRRSLARAHLLFAGGAEWAAQGLERGEALAGALQAQQS